MNDGYLARVIAIGLTLPLLGGCAAGLIAMQAIPIAIGSVAMGNAEDRDPFRPHTLSSQLRTSKDFAMLDDQIRRAECGDAESQYWLASALKNNFNATPNYVEIYKWYRLAEIGNLTAASEELTALDSTMSDPEIEEARARAREWQPTTTNCSVGG